MRQISKYPVLILLCTIVICLDQLTKFWVQGQFHLGESFPLIYNFFNITYVQNKGAAFGLLAQAPPGFRVPFFILVPIIALSIVGYVFYRLPQSERKLAFALSIVIGGAMGNLIDRITLGYVIDFLDFHWKWGYHFPAFNLADSCICVGVGIIMFDIIMKEFYPHASGSH